MKSQFILAFVAVLGCTVLAGQPAQAKKRSDLLNQALNHTLDERQKVENSYRSNSAAVHPGEAQVAEEGGRAAIAVEVGDELSSGSARDWAPSGEDRAYRESNAVEKLERELKEVDNSFRSREGRLERDRSTREARQIREPRERARARGRNL